MNTLDRIESLCTQVDLCVESGSAVGTANAADLLAMESRALLPLLREWADYVERISHAPVDTVERNLLAALRSNPSDPGREP